jgi:hypothetical protein
MCAPRPTPDVAELAGITPASLARQRVRGAVPEPDGYLGRTPWWRRATVEEWLKSRPRRGQRGPAVTHRSRVF